MANHNTERVLIAQIAANERWARLSADERTTATQSARDAAEARFERLVDPDGKLAPSERRRQAANARRAHFQKMALKSAQSRRRRGRTDSTRPNGGAV